MNISVSPEELRTHSQNIIKQTALITEELDKIVAAKDRLSGWQSSNKDLFVNKMLNDVKNMRQMVEAAESYGLVGRDVAERVINVENSIRNTIVGSEN